MPKLFSSKHIIRTIEKEGFKFISQKGSHLKYKKLGDPVLITIIPANKKEIPYGTFRAILQQTKLTEEIF